MKKKNILVSSCLLLYNLLGWSIYWSFGWISRVHSGTAGTRQEATTLLPRSEQQDGDVDAFSRVFSDNFRTFMLMMMWPGEMRDYAVL
jgi:hypothetical protein